MTAPAPDPRDPRFRPYRAVTLGIYLVVTVTFSLLIIFSVYRSVLRMTPDTLPPGELQTEELCLRDARGLFDELEQQRKLQGDQADVVRSDQRFLQFRVEWLQRKRAIESRCGLDNRARSKAAFASLEKMLDLYTTVSVQFSGAVGPTVDEFKKQLEPR
jgi:hypothetical protein